MTEKQRIVQSKHHPEDRYIHYGEVGDYAWVADMSRPESPFTARKDDLEDVPKYPKGQVPQVGEVWVFGWASSPLNWVCVRVDEENGWWYFLAESQVDHFAKDKTGKTPTTSVSLHARQLPETEMKKVS